MNPTTVFYLPAFLGSLGQFSDELTVATVLRERRSGLPFELVVDTSPRRPAWEHLLDKIRRRHVKRLIVRSFSDLCLTTPEIQTVGIAVVSGGMDFVRLFPVPPSVLLLGYPRRLGLYRHWQQVAKVVRLRRHGFRIEDICHLVHATPRQVVKMLKNNGLLSPLTLF